MELLMDVVMELVPDVVTEFFSEKCFGFIRKRVENRVARGILYAFVALVLAVLGVLLGFGLICLISVLFQ